MGLGIGNLCIIFVERNLKSKDSSSTVAPIDPYYKGHKDKIKGEGRGGEGDGTGWGGVEGRGENADNCN